jgi:hypothetical protein
VNREEIRHVSKIVTVLLFAFVLVGCTQAGGEDPTAGIAPGQETTPGTNSAANSGTNSGAAHPDDFLVLGSPSDTTTEIVLINESGRDIVGLQIRDSTVFDYGPELFVAAEPWANGQGARIYADLPTAGRGAASEGRESAGIVLNTLYDIRLTMADESVHELHAVNLHNLIDARIRTEEEIAYLLYQEGDVEASTLAAERGYQG